MNIKIQYKTNQSFYCIDYLECPFIKIYIKQLIKSLISLSRFKVDYPRTN